MTPTLNYANFLTTPALAERLRGIASGKLTITPTERNLLVAEAAARLDDYAEGVALLQARLKEML